MAHLYVFPVAGHNQGVEQLPQAAPVYVGVDGAEPHGLLSPCSSYSASRSGQGSLCRTPWAGVH